ncbi:MAG: CotH kinase family protein [Limisphaerales bacterium]
MKRLLILSLMGATSLLLCAQETPRPQRPQGGPGGFGGGPGGPGGPPGGMRQETKLVKQFDKDGDKRLNAAERKAAREFLKTEIAEGRGPRRMGPRGGNQTFEAKPGPKVTPAEVKNFGDAPFYDIKTLRTLFFEFENDDWSKELWEFNNSDVEVPAKLTVDGKTYKDVGVHNRGASSLFSVSAEGQKRSMSVSVDFAHEDQNVLGYRSLNLLNSHRDPTYARTVLYYHVAGQYIPTPKANYVRVVINGESWGPYVNAQQFNKEFINEHFGTTKGARWKVPGSPRGRGGLEYLGEDPAAYKEVYEIKSKNDPKSWKDLINLCKVLNNTDTDKLEQALAPILNVDGVLKFLALENTLINSDGYWIRASDYNLYQDEKGVFHIIPHDANETFSAPQGPGARGGIELDPMAGKDEPAKPLLSKLLAVPSLKARYLGYVRHIAEHWLDWQKVGPLAEQFQSVIVSDIKSDTHKLDSEQAFKNGLTQDEGRNMSIKTFVERRQAYLLGLPDVKNAKIPGKL